MKCCFKLPSYLEDLAELRLAQLLDDDRSASFISVIVCSWIVLLEHFKLVENWIASNGLQMVVLSELQIVLKQLDCLISLIRFHDEEPVEDNRIGESWIGDLQFVVNVVQQFFQLSKMFLIEFQTTDTRIAKRSDE